VDIATILGALVAFGLVGGSIALGGGSAFIDPASAMIVLGGTTGAIMLATSMEKFQALGKVFSKALTVTPIPMVETATNMVEFAQIARREGMLSLEQALTTADPFMANGIQLAIDGIAPDVVEDIMYIDLDRMKARHKAGNELMSLGATFAPAMGLIGTLIGLVQMLQNMSDPNTIGPAMAVALLTTFYGALLANLVFVPISSKLKMRSTAEIEFRELMMEGVMAIAKGESPRMVEKKLNAMLPPADRLSLFD